MATSTIQPAAAAPSPVSIHSSTSQTTLSRTTGQEHGPPPSRPTTRGSTSLLRVNSKPSDYLIPGVAPDTYIIYAIAGARIYHSTQLTGNHTGALSFGWGHSSGNSKDKSKGSQWVFSHLKGTLVFGRDKRALAMPPPPTAPSPAAVTTAVAQGKSEDPNAEWWFQLVDDNTGKVAWTFKIPLSPSSTKINYELDRPFFHVFSGSSRKYGLLFDDDSEAATFSTEVISRTTAALAANSKPSKIRSRSLSVKIRRSKSKDASSSSTAATQGHHRGISTSMISSPAPDSFKHLNHIGINSTSGSLETSKNLDPSFREILSDLRLQSGTNMTEGVVLEHLDFVQGFWKDINTLQRGQSVRQVTAN